MIKRLFLVLSLCLMLIPSISSSLQVGISGEDNGIGINLNPIIPTFDNSTAYVNNSANWIGMDNFNETQMDDGGDSQTLNILESWLGGLYCKLTGCTMTGDIDMGGNDLINMGNVWNKTDLNATTLDHTSGADLIGIPVLNGANWTNIHETHNLFNSAGRITGGLITEGAGSTIEVAEGTGFIKALDEDTAELMSFNWDAVAGKKVDANSIMYYGIDYNGGTPIVTNMTIDDWDLDTQFPLGSVINQGGELYILNNPWWVGDGLTNMIEKSEGIAGHLARDKEVGGLILGVAGTRNPTMSSGTLWGRTNEFEIPEFDASTGDVFDTYYRDGAGSYNEIPDVSQYNVSHYDDNSGTLQPLNNNWYAVHWVWINVASEKISMIYPQNQYATSASAEAEEIPNTFPSMWFQGGIIIGRIIIKEGVDAPVQVQSVFTTTFTAAQASDHGNLGGLEDDDHPQYWKVDGTSTATDNWNIGAFGFKAGQGNFTDMYIDNIRINLNDISSDTGTIDILDIIASVSLASFGKLDIDNVIINDDKIGRDIPTEDRGFIQFRNDGGGDFTTFFQNLDGGYEFDGTAGADFNDLDIDTTGTMSAEIFNADQNKGTFETKGTETGIFIDLDPAQSGKFELFTGSSTTLASIEFDADSSGESIYKNAMTGKHRFLDGSTTILLMDDTQANFSANLFADKLTLGSNVIAGLSSGDANVSTLFYDTLTAKSPTIMCSEDWCSVSFPKRQKTLWIQKDINWSILDIVYEEEHYTKTEFNSEICSMNEMTQEICSKLNSKIQRLQEKVIADKIIEAEQLAQKQIKDSCEYFWDGECFEVVKTIADYNGAVEVIEIPETEVIATECFELNNKLEVVSYECNQIVETGSLVDSYQFKEGCNWNGNYYCEVRTLR